MQSLGGLGAVLDKLPGMGNMAQMAEQADVTRQFKRMEALINSMTPAERRDPEILNGSRKRRIVQGAGADIQDLNRLLKQHKQMGKMMKKLKGGGMTKMMRGMSGLMGGGLPPGFGR
jgi:signal recognition particle subunit SRP54